jgi:hypothetical protein
MHHPGFLAKIIEMLEGVAANLACGKCPATATFSVK